MLDYTPDYINYLEGKVVSRDKVRDFPGALKKKGINIIAEIKKASPSKGTIREDFDPAQIGKIYEENGASAISVLTDRVYFKGDVQFLRIVRAVTTIPLLRKDFIIDKRQILEAYAYGADSYLLIARVLSEKELQELISYGRGFGMEPLVEIHTFEEGAKSLNAGAKIVGINNRDLETFTVDINLSKKLAPEMKSLGAEIVVAESGISEKKEIMELKECGVDAFLIGEALMREKDIGKKLQKLIK
ncbi:MAG: indole-3-glycerol phosphate synthase TrpC [Persephonella sp.]|nr:indole-3-glycerol phosphate synthase TrpC [Persephonella sp.]